MQNVQPYLIGLIFVGAGSLHFFKPQMYEAIMPPYVPAHRELVLASGLFEILGGVGVMIPQTRKAAGWGLIALLVAVFPANVYMAVDTAKFGKLAPAWVLYARLPLQFLLMWWIYGACIAE